MYVCVWEGNKYPFFGNFTYVINEWAHGLTKIQSLTLKKFWSHLVSQSYRLERNKIRSYTECKLTWRCQRQLSDLGTCQTSDRAFFVKTILAIKLPHRCLTGSYIPLWQFVGWNFGQKSTGVSWYVISLLRLSWSRKSVIFVYYKSGQQSLTEIVHKNNESKWL